MACSTAYFHLSSVSPSIPAIRSILTCGNPTARIHSQARKISGDLCALPLDESISSSKCSTPSDSRVTPIFLIV
jgi:hypothetical protein